uniref:Uncharacterized protein n=1 Tax=Clastoptera arizonana TaxID=38151 RepID=A0A1B6DV62_9HEMI
MDATSVVLYLFILSCDGQYDEEDEYSLESSDYHKNNFEGESEEANELFNNLTKRDKLIYRKLEHPVAKDGDKLCHDIISFNENFDMVVKPISEHKLYAFKIAKLLIDSQGPSFLHSSPRFHNLQKLNQWSDQKLGHLCRLIVSTKMLWEELKDSYMDMSLRYAYKHIF